MHQFYVKHHWQQRHDMKLVQPFLFFNLYLLMLIAFPVVGDELRLPPWIFDVCMLGVVLFGMILPLKWYWPLWLVGGLKVALNIFHLLYPVDIHAFTYPYKIGLTLIFGFMLAIIFIRETVHARFSYRLLYQSIATYLLIGVFFALLYRLLHLQDQHAFNFQVNNEFSHVYFSFIILTSVGLGDMLPVSSAAKAVTLVESLAGQIYLVFFVSIMLSKYPGHKKS